MQNMQFMKGGAHMEKRFHTDTRVSENFSIKGLQSLTGQIVSNFLQYLTKEIIDNSLEATEYPQIDIIAQLRSDYDIDVAFGNDICISLLSIRDNGPGISEETIYKIFKDIENFGGTKRHYKLPTRGAQGNALMTVLGIQNLFDSPLVVISNSEQYTISVVENDLTGCPEILIEKQQAEKSITGFEIKLKLPDYYENDIDIGRVGALKETFFKFIELNPHATFRLVTGKGNHTFIGNPQFTGYKLKLGQNNTTGKVTWFSTEEFFNRIKADARIEPNLELHRFVQEFYGFSSYSKAKEVIDEFKNIFETFRGINKISDFFNNSHLNEETASWLYYVMGKFTTPFNERTLPKTLGSIGVEGMKYSILESLKLSGDYEKIERIVGLASEVEGSQIQSIDDLIVYYSEGRIVEEEKVIPHFFEMIAIPLSWEQETFTWYSSRERQVALTFGINQSFIYSVPSVDLTVKRRSGKEKSYSDIKSAFYDFPYRFKIICNLTCPTIDYKDKGKQLFDTAPFVDTINEVLGKTIRKFETDIIPVLNKLNEDDEDEDDDYELGGKAPKGFIKDFIFNNFMNVYNQATDNKRYTITLRQFYYAMRPLFLETIEGLGYYWSWKSNSRKREALTFDYGTFGTYVDEYEVKVLGERIIYKKDRGFFVEPHSNRQVDLGTSAVQHYFPNLREYGSLLFIEKSGFYELLHKDFEMTKKYDIGLINSEGFATNALRALVEKIQNLNPDIKLYVLTDFDIKGLGIAKNVSKPDELSPVEMFDCERLGVTYIDVIDYNLPIEPVEYDRKTVTELENRYRAGELSDEVYEFLKQGQRVEINAFTPVELKEYLERKFEAVGIEKLKPESEEDVETFDTEDLETIRKEALNEAIGEFVSENCDDEIFSFLNEAVKIEEEAKKTEDELLEYTDKDKLAKTIFDRIMEELEALPPKNWYKINEEVIDDLEGEAKEIQREYKNKLLYKAKELLEDRVSIDVKIRWSP
jgi:hypothetical protein